MIDAKPDQQYPLIVSLCGPSNAGKSQLAKAVVRRIGGEVASRVPTDYFFQPSAADMPVEVCLTLPLTWDWPLLGSLLDLPLGTQVSTPTVDFMTFQRLDSQGGLPFSIRPIMICDAMAPYPDSDLVILLDAPEPVRRGRIIERDLRWGTRVADRWNHLELTWQEALTRTNPHGVLDGTVPVEANASVLVGRLRQLRAQPDFSKKGIRMNDESHGIPVGTTVIALSGEVLGKVREVHEHYLLIDQPNAHKDLDLPVDAITDAADGKLHVSVNREALTEVDHEETVHRQEDGAGPYPEV